MVLLRRVSELIQLHTYYVAMHRASPRPTPVIHMLSTCVKCSPALLKRLQLPSRPAGDMLALPAVSKAAAHCQLQLCLWWYTTSQCWQTMHPLCCHTSVKTLGSSCGRHCKTVTHKSYRLGRYQVDSINTPTMVRENTMPPCQPLLLTLQMPPAAETERVLHTPASAQVEPARLR